MHFRMRRIASRLSVIVLMLVAVGCDTGDTSPSAKGSVPAINRQEARKLKQARILASLPDNLDCVFPIYKRGEDESKQGYGLIDQSGNELISDIMYTGVSSPFDWDDPTPFRTWIGQDGAILLAEDHYLYLGAHGKRIVPRADSKIPLLDRIHLAKNHGDSLFTLHPPFLRTKFPERFDRYGLIPIGVLDITEKWKTTENVFPRHRMTEGRVPVSNVETGKAGYADRDGSIVIDMRFDYCDPFSEGLAAVLQGDRYGYIDRQGKMILEPQFSRASWFDEGMAIVTDPGSDAPYQIDRSGKKIRDLPIEPLKPAPSILAGFYKGIRVVKYVDPDLESFDGLGGRYGYLKSDGNWLFEPKLEFATQFREGRAIAFFPSGTKEFPHLATFVIDRAGKTIEFIGDSSSYLVFSFGLAGAAGRRYYDTEANRVWYNR
ncbi:WG repeat-containing protein [Roseimaritima ulvae]|uniref:KWG Leptospira n=1 Tax=Roseimaritima ulvae TaxID=980254 RepID=A0A5B9R2X5_9BACT|nr:WG repeat-containing protein [Roseimaritima ulvae]QEG43806.1 KWG Leptospira [Roseimaritima ulvae]